jgi:hypothetical protein
MIRAVSLIVIHPAGGKILILEERNNKPHLGKYAGMFSIPMETSHPGEADFLALLRLHQEELPGLLLESLPGILVGEYQVVPGARANLYATTATTSSLHLPRLFCDPDVGNHQWVSPQKAMSLPLRQGAFEMIGDFVAGLQNVVRTECNAPRNMLSA